MENIKKDLSRETRTACSRLPFVSSATGTFGNKMKQKRHRTQFLKKIPKYSGKVLTELTQKFLLILFP